MNCPTTLPHGGLKRLAQRAPVLAREKAVLETDVEVIPRHARRHRDGAEERSRFDPEVLERLLPDVELQLVVPRIEARAAEVGALDDVREPPVAARENALEHARRGVVNAEVQAAHLPHRVAQQALLALDLRERVHRAPLKRRVRLRHVRRHADRHLHVPAELLADARARSCRRSTMPSTSSSSSVGSPMMK